MTFAEIHEIVREYTDEAAYGSTLYKALELVQSAQQNADDTLYVEKSCTEADFDRIALSSLELLVGSERDAKVRKFFDRLGFKY